MFNGHIRERLSPIPLCDSLEIYTNLYERQFISFYLNSVNL